jgi:uncharacterized protein
VPLLGGGPDHTDLTVRAQPRASRSEIVGLHGDALKVRLAAPPVEGAANRELEKVLARALGIPRSSVQVIRGASGREKVLRIHSLSPEEVRERLGI